MAVAILGRASCFRFYSSSHFYYEMEWVGKMVPSWWESKELVHPEWPGAGLLVGWFMVFVVFIRLAEFVSPRLGHAACYISAAVLPFIYIATFWWGRQFIE